MQGVSHSPQKVATRRWFEYYVLVIIQNILFLRKVMVIIMKIVKNLVSKSKYKIKCPHEMKPTRIVVHNTANDASAKNEISYMKKNNSEISFHYAVDDKEVVQGIPENRNAWHSGDGNGKGNREGIAIEICYSKSGGEKFLKAEENAVELIVDILKRYDWEIDKVTKHQDYSDKYCPHRTLDLGWERFIKMVEDELLPPEKTVKKPSSKYYKKYTGSSEILDIILKAVGVPAKYYGSWSKRKPLAKANGIKLYVGTAAQNKKIITLAKQGKLKKV